MVLVFRSSSEWEIRSAAIVCFQFFVTIDWIDAKKIKMNILV